MVKIDNHNAHAKLELRRYFLRKYPGPHHVLDCCQGEAVLWNRLREEFAIDSYWGVDLKRKKGRLKIDSTRILAQPGWIQNVIDIDTYGSPWKHWQAMLPNVSRPTTVFLTIGKGRQQETIMCNVLLGCLGITSEFAKALPKCLKSEHIFGDIGVHAMLGQATSDEIIEAKHAGFARYIGLRLTKCSDNGTINCNENGRGGIPAEHTRSERENEHV